jgi:hypothetical protein
MQYRMANASNVSPGTQVRAGIAWQRQSQCCIGWWMHLTWVGVLKSEQGMDWWTPEPMLYWMANASDMSQGTQVGDWERCQASIFGWSDESFWNVMVLPIVVKQTIWGIWLFKLGISGLIMNEKAHDSEFPQGQTATVTPSQTPEDNELEPTRPQIDSVNGVGVRKAARDPSGMAVRPSSLTRSCLPSPQSCLCSRWYKKIYLDT